MTPAADAHLHLFAEGYEAGFAGPIGTGAELVAYERLRGQFGIERGLVVVYEGEPAYAGNNEYVLTLAGERPWIAPLAYLPVEPAPTVEELRRLHARGAVGFSIYLPELFPSSLRSTGTSFCYNLGRFAAAGGSFFSAVLSKGIFANGDPTSPLPLRYSAMFMCVIFLIGLATLPFAPETKGKALPEEEDEGVVTSRGFPVAVEARK